MLLLDVIHPVEEAWRGSKLLLPSVSAGYDPILFAGQNSAKNITLIVVAVMAIVFFRQVAGTFLKSFELLFSENRRDEVLDDSSYGYLAALTIMLLIPAYSFLLKATGASTRSFWITMAVIASFILFRSLMFAIMAWVGGDYGLNSLKRHSDSTFILMMAISLPIYLVSILLPEDRQALPVTCIIIIAALCFLTYLVAGTKRIMSSRFSRFFCFLYLCTLEILPMAVVVKILVS